MDYTVNFIIWYFQVVVLNSFEDSLENLIFNMNRTLALPMATNILVPMFGDSSSFGLGISIVIRLFWALFAGIFSVIISLPKILLSVLLLIFPILPIGFLLIYLYK